MFPNGVALLTIDGPILVNKAVTNIRKTDRAEDGEIHSSFCELVVIKSKTSKFLTKTKKGDVV